MWDLPGPGLEPVSPALAGGFLTTAPPGKSLLFLLNCFELMDLNVLGVFQPIAVTLTDALFIILSQ